MTASCPMCGYKWDIPYRNFKVIMRCGDEHDIYCYRCERTITFVMDRENVQISYNITFSRYENMIHELEEKVKEATAKMEEIKKKMGEYDGEENGI